MATSGLFLFNLCRFFFTVFSLLNIIFSVRMKSESRTALATRAMLTQHRLPKTSSL
ncbi:hypothetical protein CPC08DRAFT_540137 [Agrocybe pediades]|nr:hypothetical protein CPC08DRAFT_540137 [Agrocybe pediades]